MYLLDGAIRNYAWGSHQELAALREAPTPTEHPEAEMWFGAHSGDPAPLAADHTRTLLDVITSAPAQELGRSFPRTSRGICLSSSKFWPRKNPFRCKPTPAHNKHRKALPARMRKGSRWMPRPQLP